MMTTSEPPFVGTYPGDDDFWVPADQAQGYPLRYGDLFNPPDLQAVRDSKGRLWKALMALHPSCEMDAKGAPKGVQVVRVCTLSSVSASQRDEIRVGYSEREFGVAPARVNMVYLAPSPGEGTGELYADLRQTARLSLEELGTAGRIAAMTHEARLALLRRDMLFRYRWDLPVSEVQRLEAARISADNTFKGPRPDWADLKP
jgi:hypothetical protein